MLLLYNVKRSNTNFFFLYFWILCVKYLFSSSALFQLGRRFSCPSSIYCCVLFGYGMKDVRFECKLCCFFVKIIMWDNLMAYLNLIFYLLFLYLFLIFWLNKRLVLIHLLLHDYIIVFKSKFMWVFFVDIFKFGLYFGMYISIIWNYINYLLIWIEWEIFLSLNWKWFLNWINILIIYKFSSKILYIYII